jgi:hypothetical protein
MVALSFWRSKRAQVCFAHQQLNPSPTVFYRLVIESISHRDCEKRRRRKRAQSLTSKDTEDTESLADSAFSISFHEHSKEREMRLA